MAASADKKTAEKNWLKILWAPVALLIIYAVARYNIFDEKIYMGGDNFFYYYLAKALATGQGFTDIFSANNTPHNHFPPGYPFIMSLFMRLGFSGIPFFSMLNGFIGAAIVIITYFLTLNITGSKKLGFTVGFFLALCPPFLGFSLTTMSEIPSILFTIIALLLMSRDKATNPFYRDVNFWVILGCIITVYYVRSSSVALLPAAVIFYLMRRKWLHAAMTVAGFILSVIPWIIRTKNLGGNSYIKQFLLKNPYDATLGPATFDDYLARITTNAQAYISMELPGSIMKQFFPDTTADRVTSGYWLCGLIMLALIIYGLVRLIKKQPGLVFYFLGAGAILLIWPSVWTGVRFMVPVIPFILLLLFFSIDDLMKRLTAKFSIPWNPMVLCLAGLLFMISPLSTMAETASDPYEANYQHFFDAAEWAKNNLPDTVVIASRKPEIFYYFSERRSVGYLHDTDSKKLLQNLESNRVRYVIVDQLGFSSTPRYLVPAIQKNEARFKILYQTPPPETYVVGFE